MKTWQFWPTLSLRWPKLPAAPSPRVEDLRRGVAWPLPPKWCVRIADPGSAYIVDVELYQDPEEVAVVTGLAIRRGVRMKPRRSARAGEPPDWEEGTRFDPLRAREVLRLPLAKYLKAAEAIVSDPLTREGAEKLRRVLVTPERPNRKRGPAFYEELAATYRGLAASGRSPVQEIGDAKGVSKNTVYQWLHRARKLGFLDSPTPRRRIGVKAASRPVRRTRNPRGSGS